jgi:hypothetical protein
VCCAFSGKCSGEAVKTERPDGVRELVAVFCFGYICPECFA